MSFGRNLIKVIVPLVIIAAGFAVMILLVKGRKAPVRQEAGETSALVQTITANAEDRPVLVQSTGTVSASRDITVVPQVSGVVTYVSPSFVQGGFFREGELMFEIDRSDYLYALEKARAEKSRAEYDVATAESQAMVARQEWDRLKNDPAASPNPLVLYEPQMANARASLEAAQAAVVKAELDLERTSFKAPFNLRVSSEDVDLGQYVRSGSQAAVLADTDTAEINVPLKMEDLEWLQVPREPGRDGGSKADIFIEIGKEGYKWKGVVTRSSGELDPKSRMISVIVRVEDPYGLASSSGNRPPLPTGSFVDVTLYGRRLQHVYPIPRQALREGPSVWLMDGDGRLSVKQVKVMWMGRDEAFIENDIKDGDKIVITNIAGAAPGMKLRTMQEEGGE